MSRNNPAGSGSIKDIENKRKHIIKPILDNPFTKGLEWPSVDAATSSKIMDYLTQVLSPYGNYLAIKRGSHGKNVPAPPEALKITVGFNSTVKRLEAQAAPNRERLLGKVKGKKKTNSRDNRNGIEVGEKGDLAAQLDSGRLSSSDRSHSSSPEYVGYVFVARADMTTPLLAECFPQLALAASHSSDRRVKLVELPRGAMARLLKVLSSENTSIVSLCDDWTHAQELFALIRTLVADVAVPWLEQLFDPMQVDYHSLEVAFLQTTAAVGKGNQKKKGKKMGKVRKVSDSLTGEKENLGEIGNTEKNGKRAAEGEVSLVKRQKM